MAATASRAVYVRVNLDAITNNIKVLRSKCPNPSQTGVIGVVKAGAYGHGSVLISKHLKQIGVERLAVATVDEGLHLRKHGLPGPIHILGNVQDWEMKECLDQALIPTVCSLEAVTGMSRALQDRTSDAQTNSLKRGSVNIKVDSGMSRNGCQPSDLSKIIEKCESSGVPIDGIFTHFSDSWGNPQFTKLQIETFLDAVGPYRKQGIHCHVANSGAILRGYGTDLDFIRPGIAMYGLPPDDASEEFRSFGLRPAAAVVGHPTLVKTLPAGRKVGYSCSYTTTEGEEHVATIPIGYADGYWRQLSGRGLVIRDKTGEKVPVIGRVSMDTITIKVPEPVPLTESFTIISDDYDPQTSACGIAAAVGTISYEVGTRLSYRLPRVYEQESQPTVIRALTPEDY